MATATFNRFTFDRDYRIGYCETEDPRILAVLECNEYSTLNELFDGDAITPIYYREYRSHGRLDHGGGYDDDTVASAWTEAYNRAPHVRYQHSYYGTEYRPVVDPADFADRFVRIFHGAEVEHTSGGYRPDGEYLIFDTPTYRKHIDDTPDRVSREAVEAMAEDVRRALDGEVYGIGYATSSTRTTTETPVDLDDPDQDWNVDMQCWGYIGNEYAATQALAFEAGKPTLPPMLPGTDPALHAH